MNATISEDILMYNKSLSESDRKICEVLAREISNHLPEADNMIWHRHPVWFLDVNPIVGYSKQKQGLRLMFWSGADFSEESLKVIGGKFKDASILCQDSSEINSNDLKRWLEKSREIRGL